MKTTFVLLAVLCLIAYATAFHVSGDYVYKSEILESSGLPPHMEEHIISPLPHTYLNMKTLPESFDWSQQREITLARTKNQHIPVYCGSCWAFGNLSALESRISIIRKNAFPHVELSPQAILNCQTNAGTCNGGTSPGLLASLKVHGVPLEDCQNYEAKTGTCPDTRSECKDCSRTASGESYCWPLYNFTRVYVEEYGRVSGVENIKAEIYARGPISAGINANGILNLTNSYYTINEDTCRKYGEGVNHVLQIIGWETEEVQLYDSFGLPNGTEKRSYWIIVNSWGSVHGKDGRGRIAMGGNCLGIESYNYWMTPVLSSLPPY